MSARSGAGYNAQLVAANHGRGSKKVEGFDGSKSREGSRPMPIRVLLVDDHAVVRDGVSYLLNAQSDIVVVGGAQTAWQAVQLVHGAARCRGRGHHPARPERHRGDPADLRGEPGDAAAGLSMHSSPDTSTRRSRRVPTVWCQESAGSEVVAAVRAVYAGKTFSAGGSLAARSSSICASGTPRAPGEPEHARAPGAPGLHRRRQDQRRGGGPAGALAQERRHLPQPASCASSASGTCRA